MTGARQARAQITIAAAIVAILSTGIAVTIYRETGSHSHAGAPKTAEPSPRPSPLVTQSASPTVGPTATPTPRAVLPTDADLFTPPATFMRVSDETAGTGPIDAAKAVALDGTGSLSRTGLAQLGFVRGVSRQWRAGSVTLVDLVYTFGSPNQALAYTATSARGADYVAITTPVGAPSGARFFSITGPSSKGEIVTFASGTHAVVMGLLESDAAPDLAQLVALATEQDALSARS